MTKMDAKGDSGELILNHDNYAIGLNASGSSKITAANPIDLVLKELNVSLVTK